MMEAKEVQKEETMVFDIEIKTDSEKRLISKYCPACAKRIQREKSNESKRRSRERNRRACIELSAKNDRLISNSRRDVSSDRATAMTPCIFTVMSQKGHLIRTAGR